MSPSKQKYLPSGQKTKTSGKTLSYADAINRAASLFHSGKLAEAEGLCRDILRAKANDLNALHLLGVLKAREGNPDEGLAYFDQALRANPKSYEVLFNRGMTLQALKRHDEAIETYDRALSINPDCAESLNNRGDALQALKRYSEAIHSYDQALSHRPDYVQAMHNRGNAFFAMARYGEALASCDQVLSAQPHHVESLTSRGNALRAMQRQREAIAAYDGALSHNPDYAVALNNRGVAIQDLGRYDEAIASYDQALSVDPNYAEAFYNRGNALQALRRYHEALASYEKALSLKPDHAEALSNRGNALDALRRYSDALESYDKALSVKPEYADALWNKSLLLLLMGEFDSGWKLYEWRWKRTGAPAERAFAKPLWLGQEDVRDRRVLLHAEQGFGDTIQFSRYAKAVAARGAIVVLEVQKPLEAFLRSMEGPSEVISTGDPLPEHDLHCPVLSLPLALETSVETIPNATPYLKTDPAWRAKWAATLGPSDRLRIGVVWWTSTKIENRSLPLHLLSPLLSLPVEWICLQKEIAEADRTELTRLPAMRRFESDLQDFSDTAALVELCDLVISIDTVVVHVAGALGKPVWVLLPFSSDWRWLNNREDSPWYPTARLFRQPAVGDWSGLIDRVTQELEAYSQDFAVRSRRGKHRV